MKFLNLKVPIIITSIFLLTLSASANGSSINSPELEIVPYYQIVPCTGSSNQLTKINSSVSQIVGRTGRFYGPGSTATVTDSYAVTISNSATIALIPEFLSLGYQHSYTAGRTLGWSKTNNNSYTQEIVVKAYYDRYKVVMLTYLGQNDCKLNIVYKNLYKGWGWDLD